MIPLTFTSLKRLSPLSIPFPFPFPFPRVVNMVSSGSFLRQISGKEGWKSSSKRWSNSNSNYCEAYYGRESKQQMERLCGNMMLIRKRVMVVIDQTPQSKDAMMWALTHITNKGDILTLLHILPPNDNGTSHSHSHSHPSCSLNYLAAELCKSCKPEVDIEALVVQGPKLATVMSQVKKLEVSVLVLGQKKSTPLLSCICGSNRAEEFVEHCINNVECLSIGVRKQSKGMGGYLISTRWHKNFWLLA